MVIDVDERHRCVHVNPAATLRYGDRTGQLISDVLTAQPDLLELYNQICRDGGRAWTRADDRLWQATSRVVGMSGRRGVAGHAPRRRWVRLTAIPVGKVAGTWEFDLDARIVALAEPGATALGLPARIDLSAGAPPLIDARTVRALTRALGRLVAGRRQVLECDFPFKAPGDRTGWLAAHGFVTDRDAEGRATRIAGSVRDVTLNKLDAVHQVEFGEQLARYQKMEAIGQLAKDIAHDFNNVLATTVGYAELALMEVADLAPNPKLNTFLQEIYQSGRRAQDLVAQMLTFSRGTNSTPRMLDLAEELPQALRLLRSSLPASIEIRADLDDSLPGVLIDESLLQQLLMNVAMNAREAMNDTGTLVIRARDRQLRGERCASCHARFEGAYVELAVEDTGVGVPASALERMFEPFTSSRQASAGMGLAVVHGILHSHDGHVLVDSIPGDGTELRFFLPHASGNPTPAPYLEQAPTPAAAAHILVVDDEVSLVYFLRELLVRRGFTVTVASDSREALDLFAADPAAFDVVVTDQTMPGLSGLQLAARMLEMRPGLPVILCTGYADVALESRPEGIAAFMPKPVDSRALIGNIVKLLGRD